MQNAADRESVPGAELKQNFLPSHSSGMDEFSAERIVLKENFLCKLGFLFERTENFIFVTSGNIEIL